MTGREYSCGVKESTNGSSVVSIARSRPLHSKVQFSLEIYSNSASLYECASPSLYGIVSNSD